MKLRNLLTLSVSLLAVCAQGNTPVAVWYQPVRNVPMLAKMGIDTFVGPEVENGRNLTPEQLGAAQALWIKTVYDNGGKCILKNPTGPLPPNCVGILISKDEPNGKGITAAALAEEVSQLRARYPGVPIFLSLAGDKVTSANFNDPLQLQAYLDYAAQCDVFTIDVYSKNRNATHYPLTWSGDAVEKLAKATGKPVWAWIEMNDQQLPVPTSKTDGLHVDINREPTPDEITTQVNDCLGRGAKGVGWFPTCDSGKYGWPGSYWPLVNRAGVSIQPQLDRVAQISLKLTGGVTPPPTVPPVVTTDVTEVLKRLDLQGAQLLELKSQVISLGDRITKLEAAVAKPKRFQQVEE